MNTLKILPFVPCHICRNSNLPNVIYIVADNKLEAFRKGWELGRSLSALVYDSYDSEISPVNIEYEFIHEVK